MMNTFDIKIPYVEVRNKNRDIVGIIEGAEIFFEYAFHESGDFEIYCRATQNNLTLLQKDYYITLPVNADTTENLVEENSNMWVIKKIQKTNDAVGGRWIVATGKEAKQIVDKRIIRNTAKLDKDADISTEVRTKLFMPNLLEPVDARRPIKGFVFEENAIGVNIAQDTQVTYENLFTYTEELYKPYGVGAKLRLDRNTKNMIYTIYKGNDRSNDIIFSQGNENLLNSDYTEDWSEYKTSALIGGEEKEEIETDPNTGETVRKYTTRTMIVLEDSSEDTDRCEVFVDAKDLQSSYNEDVNGVTVERTYTPAVYKKMLRARGKEKLASENNVIREFNGEIDVVNNRVSFNHKDGYYLGDLVKIRDDDLQKEITVRVSKFIKVQNEEGYKEYFEYEELSTLNYEGEGSEEVEGALLTEDEENLLTEDNNVLLVEEVPTTYSTRSTTTTSTGGVRISELPFATNVTEGCCLPIVSEYETKKISYGALKERLSADLDIESYDDTEIKNELAEVKDSIPTKNSQLINDEGFIKNTVDNLTNYYLKSQSYTKDEVNTLVNSISSFDAQIVSALPTTNISTTTIYLIAKTDTENNDYYDEYLYINNSWEMIGNTKIDLTNYVTTDTSQDITATKSFKSGIFAKTYWGEKGSIIASQDTDGTVDLGDPRYGLSITSKTRPIVNIQGEALGGEIALKSEIPTDYAKASEVPNKTSDLINDNGFITQQTLDLNYYTAGETEDAIKTATDKLSIPRYLSQLETDSNNQRVSSAEKTAWNNKSDFNGSYNSLTNKPDLSNYLTASGGADITGRKTFTGTNLQISNTAGSQPVYIYTDANGGFHVNGMWDLIELDGDTDTIRLLGCDIARKEDIPDIGDIDLSNYVTKDELPDISNFATKSEIPDVSNFATKNEIYPVGSIYLTVETSTTGAVSPASFLGGTWERLPEGYALWTASSSAGTTISAGLPNISGSFQLANHSAENTTASGAFVSTSGDSASYTGSSSNKRARTDVEFYASNSNSIYGNSTTVQPPAYKVYAWKRIS